MVVISPGSKVRDGGRQWSKPKGFKPTRALESQKLEGETKIHLRFKQPENICSSEQHPGLTAKQKCRQTLGRHAHTEHFIKICTEVHWEMQLLRTYIMELWNF